MGGFGQITLSLHFLGGRPDAVVVARPHRRARLLLLVACTSLLGCATAKGQAQAPARLRDTPIHSWAMQLDGIDLQRLARTALDLIVVDRTRGARGAQPFTRPELSALRSSRAGAPRVLLAYVSVGQVETYREHWNPRWHRERPDWLGPEDPDWPKHHEVRYWLPGWESLVLEEVRRAATQGFDGVYLDRVDAFEVWSQHRRELAPRTARRAMAQLVSKVAAAGRAVDPRFVVVIQNGTELTREPGFWSSCDGVSAENLLLDDTGAPLSDDVTGPILEDLARTRAAGRVALAVDYPRTGTARKEVLELRQRGIVPFVASFGLATLDLHDLHDLHDLEQR